MPCNTIIFDRQVTIEEASNYTNKELGGIVTDYISKLLGSNFIITGQDIAVNGIRKNSHAQLIKSINEKFKTDIIKTVDYLLSLGKSALPFEIVIGSLPFTKKITKVTYELYELK